MDNDHFNLKISSREGLVFEGKVRSISSYNNKGKFDILALHSNFISLLEKEIVYTDMHDTSHKVDIDSALLRQRGNKAEIYIGIKSFSEISEKEKND